MDAGWAWQIEHEHFINRGYVYSSRFISDDAARAELLGKNPKISNEPRIVKFRTGRYERMWVENVVGSAMPPDLSSRSKPPRWSRLSCNAARSRIASGRVRSSRHLRWWRSTTGSSEIRGTEVRDFIALHYRFNQRLDTPFWRTCHAETELGGAQPLVDFYRENGPTSIHQPLLLRQSSTFGMEGYLALLVGQKVPHQKPHQPTRTNWNSGSGSVGNWASPQSAG
jgi:tryptophan halogenase